MRTSVTLAEKFLKLNEDDIEDLEDLDDEDRMIGGDNDDHSRAEQLDEFIRKEGLRDNAPEWMVSVVDRVFHRLNRVDKVCVFEAMYYTLPDLDENSATYLSHSLKDLCVWLTRSFGAASYVDSYEEESGYSTIKEVLEGGKNLFILDVVRILSEELDALGD